MGGKAKDLRGEVFNRLTIIEYAEHAIEPNGAKRRQWICECECGNIRTVRQRDLVSGNTKSCGCFNKEQTSKATSKRFESLAKYMVKEYDAFSGMKTRCYNPKADSFTDYGARGIKVCDEWMGEKGFLLFFDALGPAPKDSFLDREDPNGNYTPENCRWVTPSMSAFNKRKPSNNTSGRTGVSWCERMEKWKTYIRVDYKEIHLGYFSSFDVACAAREQAELKYFGFIKEE